MNAIKTLSFVCLLAALAGCKHADYKKTKTGMLYDIISDEKGSTVKQGQLLKVNYKTVLDNDSVLENTFDRVPAYGMVDTTQNNLHNFTDILPLMRVGDSAVIVRFADTLRKMGQIPPTDSLLKSGATLKVYVKVLKSFKDEAELRADYAKEEEKELAREKAQLRKYLTDQKISFKESPNGVFVQIINPGTGPKVDTGKSIAVLYRGTNLAGNIFDSNMDEKFGRKGQPFEFVIGSGQVIPGWDEGLRLFNQGGKGKLYIPAMLAYRGQAASDIIKPYTNLVFDVELVGVKDAPPAPAMPQMPPMGGR